MYMAVLIIIAVVMWMASALAEPATSRSFYDHNGSFAGSSVTRGNSTSFTDRQLAAVMAAAPADRSPFLAEAAALL